MSKESDVRECPKCRSEMGDKGAWGEAACASCGFDEAYDTRHTDHLLEMAAEALRKAHARTHPKINQLRDDGCTRKSMADVLLEVGKILDDALRTLQQHGYGKELS